MNADTSQRITESRAPRSRLVVPLALILLGALVLILTPAQVIDSATDPVGPRFLPYLTGTAIVIGGLADLVIQLREGRATGSAASAASAASDEQPDEPPEIEPKSRLISYGLILIGIAIWVYTTVLIGYGLSSLILMALTAVAFGLKKPVQLIILIVVTVGVTYYVFAELLQVQLLLIGW